MALLYRDLQDNLREAEAVGAGGDGYRDALVRRAELELLAGAAFAGERARQRAAYQRAFALAELALRQRPAIEAVFAHDGSFEQVLEQVEEGDFDPLLLRATATFYLYRDVYGLWERMRRRADLAEARVTLETMAAINPAWEEGVIQFSLGIYYLSLPRVLGGDLERARGLMDEAVELGPRRLVARWGRGKYLAVRLGDEQLFREDLQWVASFPEANKRGPDLWNRYFQLDARTLLNAMQPDAAQ
jgi:hypothetical protein